MTLQLESFILFSSKLSFRTSYDFDLNEAIHVHDFIKMFYCHWKSLIEYQIQLTALGADWIFWTLRVGAYSRLGVYKISLFPASVICFFATKQSMVIINCKEVTKQDFCKILWRNRNKQRNKRRQLSSLAANGWIVEEPERLDRTSACKAHSCSHFGPCFDHTSPTQTDNGTSQIDHDIGANVPYSFQTMSRVLLHPLPTEVQGWRRQGQQLNVTAQWRDHLNWERSFTASMISPVF